MPKIDNFDQILNNFIKNMIAIGPNGLPEVHDHHAGGHGRVEEGGNGLEGVQYS